MDIKTILKRNKLSYYVIKHLREIQYTFLPYIRKRGIFNLKRLLRVTRINRNSPFEKLKGVKNKHKGERCFIVATGPSLTIDDLEKLEDEITIGMNSICLAFDETDWRPTYYGIQDENVYSRMKKFIDELDTGYKFVSQTIPEQLKMEFSSDYYYFPMDMLNHNLPHETYNTKFSSNPFSVVYNGYTITYSLIQIAVYMGFKEIYLIGADCNYGKNTKHHFKEYDLVDPTFASAGEMMTAAYKVARQYAEKHNIKIYNATRGGMLEVFERVDLDEVLLKKEQSETLAV